ncbi:MAG: dihydrolipoamide dehydrogenase [Winogradskyella sp.]|uniref:dihydrolipoamide dehydrogenase n=1 Tax=Winogradskyella sp. TaxID=1883156 RepID=UPI0025E55CDE|nr:dihydrolipoamide dehydrogenase [Winogradskyella sp.]NRB59125.1 dihydrolipoamide dehydrogenase [Winogradskyella sp.]
MKRIFSFIAVFTLLLTSCEGPQGPPGLDGLNGLNGVNFVGQSFETDPLDFFVENNYEQLIIIPNNVEVLETDMILVYLLWDENPDIWRLLPQTIYTDNGEFQYNYDSSFGDVRIFLDAPAEFDFDSLSAADTLNQIFRVVVLPVDLINSNQIDINNYDDVVNYVQ